MRYSSSLSLALLQGAGHAAAQFVYADNQVPVVKDSDRVARLFPEVEDIELLSPAFTNTDSVPEAFAEGTSGPTDQLTLEHFLQTLAARNDWMSYHNTLRSEEGRSLPYVFLSTSNKPSALSRPDLNSYSNSTTPESSGKVRVWMQGGVHGNEPAGDQALLALLGKLDANATWAESILENVDILMLPRYNPDGVAYFQVRLFFRMLISFWWPLISCHPALLGHLLRPQS